MNKNNYIAIDIAKDSLAVHAESFSGSFPYTPADLKRLLAKIKAVAHPLVVCEATGGYERKLMELLHKQKIPVALVNPARVRNFARSDGIKAKTDPIDARVLLAYAESKRLEPTPPPPPQQQKLQALMDRRSQLTGSLAREKNRLEKCPELIRKSIQKMIRIIEKEIAMIEKEIKKTIAEDEALSRQDTLMQSVSGVGETTSWSVLAYLSEITALKRNQLIALAGVAPYAKDSGKHKGKRRIEGGRAKLRKCLFMAARTAATHNPHIKAYTEALQARGKPYKCAIVAAMRKILIHLQSILKNQEKCLA